MVDIGIPHEPDERKPEETTIFSFPIRSPESSTTYKDYDPIEHLDLWLLYQKYWCDHKPSVTINYTDENYLAIGQWVYDNWDWVSGISFLPKSDHVYNQAPFEAISEKNYLELSKFIPNSIDWSELSNWEIEDTTVNSHSLACVNGSCETVDITEN